MKLKKSIIPVCCVIIAALVLTLTGCVNNSDKGAANNNDTNVESSSNTNAESTGGIDLNDENLYLGTWKATITEEADGSIYDYEKNGPATEMTLYSDHTFSTQVNDDVYDNAGKWEFTKGGVKITRNDFGSAICTYKDGELLWVMETENGKSTTHFVKKK